MHDEITKIDLPLVRRRSSGGRLCEPIRWNGRLTALVVWSLVAAACGTAGGTDPVSSGESASGARRSIAVIPKGTTHLFWNSVERGARRAGDDLDVEVIWKGPLKESDRAQQIQVVQQFVTQGVDGIALAPLDYRALVGAVRTAKARGVPVVIIDSALEGEAGEDFVSFVATDNEDAGRMGGEHLAGVLGGEGSVILFRYMVGSASTDAREQGFLDAIASHPGLTVAVENRYAGATAGEAKTEALNMIEQIRAADGVFCPNESSTYGLLLALRQVGLAGQVRVVGFDASPPLVEALKSGELDALVVQDPETMGYKAVETLTKHLDGGTVELLIDTGAIIVTRENLDDPDVRRLIGE